MGELIRRNRVFFILATLAAIGLRLFFVFKYTRVDGDSLVYGELAKNLLQHGVYGFATPDSGIVPTYIRVPGYPLLMAAAWAVAGVEHYRAVIFVQLALDLGTVFVVAAIARRVIGNRAAKAAFLLAALCPFTSTYVACPLTEVPEIFCTALAFYFAVRGLEALEQGRSLGWWAASGAAVAGAILMRPDGGLLLGAIGLYLIAWLLMRPYKTRIVKAAVVLSAVALAPLVPWAIRNWRVFHEFQPLAPYHANGPGEFVALGFDRWTKSWIVDYVSVEDVYWPEPGEEVDISELPTRAYDSEQQRQETSDLLDEYNAAAKELSPELDAKFAALAAERIRAHPLRYYVELPVLRAADMWLRPRTEMLGLDSRWWEVHDHPRQSAWAIFLGVINLAYVIAALAGWISRRTLYAGMFATFVFVRTAFFGIVPPEPRYMLECYPVVFLFAAAVVARTAEENPTSRKSGDTGHPEAKLDASSLRP